MRYFNTWGGGGWGDPYQRDPALVLTDYNRGLVTAEGAKAYGVVLENGAVNEVATIELRATLTEQRGEISLFNKGGTIEEIKARCLEETHIPAPITPTFQNVK